MCSNTCHGGQCDWPHQEGCVSSPLLLNAYVVAFVRRDYT